MTNTTSNPADAVREALDELRDDVRYGRKVNGLENIDKLEAHIAALTDKCAMLQRHIHDPVTGFAPLAERMCARAEQAEARLAALAGAAPVAWRATTIGYKQFITDAQYQKFSPEVRRWYQPYRCVECSTHAPAKAREVTPEMVETLRRMLGSVEKLIGNLPEALIAAHVKQERDALRAALATLAEGSETSDERRE